MSVLPKLPLLRLDLCKKIKKKNVQSMFLAILTLETNEIQRMFWFASDYSNTAFQFQEVLRMNTNIFNMSLDT